jgi:hypothetical protein
MTQFNGEILLNIDERNKEINMNLESFRLYGQGVSVKEGNSGNFSVQIDKKNIKSSYDFATDSFKCEFIADVHYPLLDKKMGYKPQNEKDPEKDVFVSYTEKYKGTLNIIFKELPDMKEIDSIKIIKDGAKVEMEMKLAEPVLGEFLEFHSKWKLDLVVIKVVYLRTTLKVQPVFISYTPEYACCCGGIKATTGGALPILKEYAIEAWDRCCIKLNFLNPVYIDNDDYRILASADFTTLRDEYDDPDAVEVYFVENFDPVGYYGGGVCYSSGTANTKIITCDANLPVNLYNLAHELGHALGLLHPPGNSTSGSLMEPSGFCLDNPPYQSDENCNNADNPILKLARPLRLCFRNTNMP